MTEKRVKRPSVTRMEVQFLEELYRRQYLTTEQIQRVWFRDRSLVGCRCRLSRLGSMGILQSIAYDRWKACWRVGKYGYQLLAKERGGEWVPYRTASVGVIAKRLAANGVDLEKDPMLGVVTAEADSEVPKKRQVGRGNVSLADVRVLYEFYDTVWEHAKTLGQDDPAVEKQRVKCRELITRLWKACGQDESLLELDTQSQTASQVEAPQPEPQREQTPSPTRTTDQVAPAPDLRQESPGVRHPDIHKPFRACSECGGFQFEYGEREQSITYKGQTMTVRVPAYWCVQCGRMSSNRVAMQMLLQADAEFRAKVDLLE